MIHKIIISLVIIFTFITNAMADDNDTIKVNVNLVKIVSADVKVSTLDNLDVVSETIVDKNGNFFINSQDIDKLSSNEYLLIYVDNIQVSSGDKPAYLKGIISIDTLTSNKVLNLNEITTYISDLFFENRNKIADNYQLLSGIIRNLGVYDINKDKRVENLDSFLYDSIITSSNLETILKLTYFYYLEQNNITKVNEYIQKESKKLNLFSYLVEVKGSNIDINFNNLDGKYISAKVVSTNPSRNYESNITTETVSLNNRDAIRYRLCLVDECSEQYTLYNDNGVIKPYIEDISDPEIVKFGEKLVEYKKVQYLTEERKKKKLDDIASILLDVTKSDNQKRFDLYIISEDNDLDNDNIIENSKDDTNQTKVETELTYGLNGTEVTNETVVLQIKNAINELETIKTEIDDLTSFDGDTLKQQYDGLKQRLDEAKSKIDGIKQSIDNNIASNDEKVALKAKADEIKEAIDKVKALVDDYKQNGDNSPEALADIKRAIDGVIGMMRSGEDSVDETKSYISIKQGRNTISGTIDVTTLPDEVHSIWIVDGGNWYGYSPYPQINDLIEDKYLLITDTIQNYKGALVYAVADTKIEVLSSDSSEDREHIYPRGYSIHGTNGSSNVSAEDVVCQEPYKLVVVSRVRGDIPSVYVPNREIDGLDNFIYLNQNDGYFVLCDK